jgi:hypothetical protein
MSLILEEKTSFLLKEKGLSVTSRKMILSLQRLPDNFRDQATVSPYLNQFVETDLVNTSSLGEDIFFAEVANKSNCFTTAISTKWKVRFL